MRIKEAIEILSKHGRYVGKIIGEDEYVFDFGEGEETFSGYQIKKLAKEYYTSDDLDFIAIAKQFAPDGNIFEIANALEFNFLNRGIVFEHRHNITFDTVYAALVAHVRHNYTKYEDGQMGDNNRHLFNDHETVKKLLGVK